MDAANYIPLATVDEVQKKSPLFRSFLGKHLGIFSGAEGEFYALEMTCKHQGANLAGGIFKGDTVERQRHAWIYDLVTGDCISHPDELPLRFHDTVVKDGKIWVCRFPNN